MYVATTHANSESVWVYVVGMDTFMDIIRSVQLQLTINNDLSNLVLRQFVGIVHKVNSAYLRVTYDDIPHLLIYNYNITSVDAYRLSLETGYMNILSNFLFDVNHRC
jgi:hypothetical protein